MVLQLHIESWGPAGFNLQTGFHAAGKPVSFLQVTLKSEPRPVSCSLKQDQASNEEEYYQVYLLW